MKGEGYPSGYLAIGKDRFLVTLDAPEALGA
jgi:hypothetical protein